MPSFPVGMASARMQKSQERAGMNLGVLIDGENGSRLDASNRGLNYGDG